MLSFHRNGKALVVHLYGRGPRSGVATMSRLIRRMFDRPAQKTLKLDRRPVRTSRDLKARLLCQPLEERLAPANLVVLNHNDSGAGSLRQAVLDANANPDADTVLF